MLTVYTIGYTGKSAKMFFESLLKSEIRRIIDIRLHNTSQLAGFTKKSDLPYFLQTICGAEYMHMPILAPTAELLDAYKKHGMDWSLYENGFRQLMLDREVAQRLPKELVDKSCLLCAEKYPIHCHRRLVAEYLRSQWVDVDIVHLT